MKKIYNLLKNYTIEDALNIEKQDLQYKSLEKLYKNIQKKSDFLSLILANSIVCYQLSSTGEKYWEEFATYFSNRNLSDGIISELSQFLPNSKGNKRFVDTKIGRLKKLELLLSKFEKQLDFDSNNIILLRDELASTMNQKIDAKTIVFAIKMLLYGLSIINNGKTIICPFKIEIPIDSRLTQIFEKYKEDYTDIKLFYNDLSKKLQIPEIHLDAIIWVNFNELMK
nr:N-glycosylase/DNA lyase [Candidatus Gracilibacteria bacterium]